MEAFSIILFVWVVSMHLENKLDKIQKEIQKLKSEQDANPS